MRVFNLYGNEYVVSDDFEKYNMYRNSYYELANSSTDEFINVYKEYITDLDILIEKVPQYVELLILNTSPITIRLLTSEGIMTVNENIFMKKYCNYFNFEKFFEPILYSYIEIVDTQEALKYNREIQNTSRGRWQGGGFGISGAVRGAMTAGALNLGSNLLHSVSNSSKVLKDKSKIASLKSNIYNNPETLQLLELGVFQSILGQFYGFIDELIENDIISTIDLNEEKSDLIYENTLKYEKNPEKFILNIIQCLMMNPYNFDLYKTILTIDKGNIEIIKMARFFGFHKEIKIFLEEI